MPNQTAYTAILSTIGENWISANDLLRKLSSRYSGALIGEMLTHLTTAGIIAQRLEATKKIDKKHLRRVVLHPSYARKRDRLEAMNLIIPRGTVR